MVTHKKQHWIPRAYLESWCDPETPAGQEPFVWRFDKAGGESKRKAPAKIFTETDLYTIRLADGTRNLALEHGLAGLESRFCELRDTRIAPRLSLDEHDRLVLCAFVAAMQARTPVQRDHWQSQWRKVFEMGEAIEHAANRMTAEQIARLPVSDAPGRATLSHQQVRALSETPLQKMLPSLVPKLTGFLVGMNLTILCTDDDPGLITSDTPCTILDPEADARPFPFNGPGLSFPKVELVLPLSPSRAVVMSWSDMPAYANLTAAGVDVMNRRTRCFCHEHFVVRRNVTRQAWFDKVPES